MEQPNLLELDKPAARVLETVVEQSDESANEGEVWPLETNEYLEWLSNFDIPQLRPEQEPENVFVPIAEEDHLVSITTQGSDVSYHHWLSSLEDNSELDHQVAEDAETSTPILSPAEFTAVELLHAVRECPTFLLGRPKPRSTFSFSR